MPRINFVSFTFLFAFGLGSFVGIAMALFAVALARPEDKTTIVEATPVFVANAPTSTPQPTVTATPTQTPVPVPKTLTALQVRIGPDDGYAILGTLASGSEIALQGRDTLGDWLAIEFPPGSSARGWIPADEVSSLSIAQVFRLDVLQASLVETEPRLPFSTSTPTAFEGNDGIPTEVPDASASSTATPSSTTSSGPAPLDFGPTDIAVGSVSLTSDGSIRIVVQNLGPRDVTGVNVEVAAGLQSEVLSTGILQADNTVVFLTQGIALEERTTVFVTADPNNLLSDLNRSNNSRTIALTP